MTEFREIDQINNFGGIIPDGYILVTEYARRKRISDDLLRNRIHARQIPFVKVDDRYYVPANMRRPEVKKRKHQT